MKPPSHECLLTAELCRIEHTLTKPPGCAPVVATRVCALARSYRRLNEAGCNRELSVAEERKMQSLRQRADALLLPYGLRMGHPWGLCVHVCAAYTAVRGVVILGYGARMNNDCFPYTLEDADGNKLHVYPLKGKYWHAWHGNTMIRCHHEKPTHANMHVLVTPTFTTSPVPVLSCWDIEDTVL